MDTSELLTPLHKLLARAQELIRLGQAEDWEAMNSVAIQYQQQIHVLDDATYIQAITDAHLAEAAKAIIVQIQHVNDELDAYASLQCEKIASELRQINQSGKALDAYGR